MTSTLKTAQKLYPRRKNDLVIKTSLNVKRPNITSKRPGGLIYELAKGALQHYGYYEDIKQYDPGFYMEKYKYKPVKRIAGKLGQKLWLPKRIRSQKRRYVVECNQLHQKFNGCQSRSHNFGSNNRFS